MYNLGDFYCKFQAAYGAGREKGREEAERRIVLEIRAGKRCMVHGFRTESAGMCARCERESKKHVEKLKVLASKGTAVTKE